MAHIKGNDVNILIRTGSSGNPTVIAGSKSCDFTATANTSDAAAKDDANPIWDNPEFTYYDWSCSNESFVVDIAYLKTLLEKVAIEDATVVVQFQVSNNFAYRGTAIITSLEIDAPNDDFVSVSLSLEGASALSVSQGITITPVTGLRNKIRGKALMVAVNDANEYRTFCYATSHKLSINVQTADVKTKDDNDQAISKEVTGKSMSLSCEHLISDVSHDSCIQTEDVLGITMNGCVTALAFGYYPDAVGHAVDSETDNWGEADQILIEGDFLCTSFSVNAPNKENSTYTAEFQLCGAPVISTAA